MPITHLTGGSTIVTGDAIAFMQLCAMRGAVKLESVGLKSRGRAKWKLAHAHYRLTCPQTCRAVLAALDALIAVERLKQMHVDADGTETVDGQRLS